jgi:uncharacterized protein
MLARPSEHRHPFTALVILLATSLAGLVIFVSIGQLLGRLIFGIDIVTAIPQGTATPAMQKLFLALYSVGTFVLPPFIYARIRSKSPANYLDFRKPKPWFLLLLAVLIMLSANSLIEWAIYVNQQMKLPAVFSKIENWMKYKEIEADLLTKQLLVMNSMGGLMLNLLVIAVIPALGEELIFRGCIQKIFSTWTNNAHAGIWIAAIIFSAIHFQFYGFIPRMLLGALFGYLFYLSKSIWVPVLAHFFNNAIAVISAYVLQQQGKNLMNLTKAEYQPGYLVVLSVIFTALFFYVFHRATTTKRDLPNERELG